MHGLAREGAGEDHSKDYRLHFHELSAQRPRSAAGRVARALRARVRSSRRPDSRKARAARSRPLQRVVSLLAIQAT